MANHKKQDPHFSWGRGTRCRRSQLVLQSYSRSCMDGVKCFWLTREPTSLKFRYFCCIAFSSHTSLVISLVFLPEVTDGLMHLGACPGVGTWHLQCLAHWGNLAEQDYNPSVLMLCLTSFWENQLWSAWQSGLVDDRVLYLLYFNTMLSYWRP